MQRFDGQAVLVTGGSSGIGMATAEAFLDEGAAVAIMGRDAARLARAMKALSRHGKVRAIRGDVSKAADARRFIEHAQDALGPIDVLVNNAGIYLQKFTQDVTEREYDRLMDINLKGAFLCSKYVLPHMIRRKRGAIVNVASDSGLVATPQASVYCASKGGLILFTRVLAVDHAKDGIRVNAICPGEVETPMLERDAKAAGLPYKKYLRKLVAPYPMNRAGKPEEIAKGILFLASDDSSFMTGACLSMDGGWTAL